MPGLQLPDDLQKQLSKFDQDADEIQNLRSRPIDYPSVIYHYTDGSGLSGILESGKLWLTNVCSLNDPSELQYGFSKIAKYLLENVRDHPSECKTLAESFASFASDGIQKIARRYYTCSFSMHGDELGQWRAYADNGRGLSVGFRTETLLNALLQDRNGPERPIIGAINYDTDEARDAQHRLARLAADLLRVPESHNLDSNSTDFYRLQLIIYLSLHTLRHALFTKHPAYKNEHEIRILQMFGENENLREVKFRPRSYELIPYREFDWKISNSDVIKEIIIGPAADQNKATHFVNECLRMSGNANVNLRYSSVPYRAQ
jgi:hypothetical protein